MASTSHGGQVDFSTGDVRRGILDVAAPMLVAQVLNLLYNIVDRIYIGKIPGEGTLALAGLGLCFPIVTLVTAFANLFGVGGAPLCSIARGQKDDKTAGKIMANAYFMLVVCGLVLTVVGWSSINRCSTSSAPATTPTATPPTIWSSTCWAPSSS